MEKQTVKKIITLSFLGAGILSYIVVDVLFKTMAGAFGSVQRYYSIDWFSHGLPIVAALITFVILQFNSKIVTWAEEIVLEVSKVVWPNAKETTQMTIYCLIFCGVSCALLMAIDFIAKTVVQFIIQ